MKRSCETEVLNLGSCDAPHAQVASPTHFPWLGYALAVFAAVGWATGGLSSKWIFTNWDVTPEALAAARVWVSTIMLGSWLIAFRRGELFVRQSQRRWIFLFLFGAIAIAGMQYTYFKTISLINVATALVLEYLAPIFTLMAGVIIYKNKIRMPFVAGVIAAIFGCAVSVGIFAPGGFSITISGLVWGIVSAIFFALYSVMGAEGNKRFSPLILLFFGLAFAALMWLVVIGPRQILHVFTYPTVAIAVVLLSIFSTVLPFAAFLKALTYISPTKATITAMLEPVVAGIAAAAFLNEPLTISLVVGATILLGAIAFIQSLPIENEIQNIPHDI